MANKKKIDFGGAIVRFSSQNVEMKSGSKKGKKARWEALARARSREWPWTSAIGTLWSVVLIS